MIQEEKFTDVILPFPIPQLFTYAVPLEMETAIGIGKRAVVQFGAKKYYTSIIANIHANKPQDFEVKELISVIDEIPVVNELQLQFWQWISDYYMCSMGEVMKASLPVGLKLESETHVFYNHSFDAFENLNDSELLVIELLRSCNTLSIQEVITKTRKKNILFIIKSLYDKGALYLEESLKSGFKAKTQTFVRLTEQAKDEIWLNQQIENLNRAGKQKDLLLCFIRLSGSFEQSSVSEVSKKILLESAETTSSVLKKLIDKGILEVYNHEISRINNSDTFAKQIATLSSPQQNALDSIKLLFEKMDTVLLHGVTSSGKTEIYLHLIQQTLEQGKQVLYLLPEIAITTQIINRLRKHFGNKVGVYHSKFSDNERVEIWNRLSVPSAESYQVIIGVRSSVFLPFSNLGLIIVDEEHETSFKQYDPAPRYNARDISLVLAKLHQAKVLLGTATPSVETYYNATNGKYGLVNLVERFSGVKMPEINLVNMRVARKKNRVQSHFSTELLNHIGLSLEKAKQVILFQNRRGFSPYIECAECGWIPKCNNCDVTLTYHKFLNQLVCHYCGYALQIPSRCKECSMPSIQTMGFGTEKIEEELSIFFPTARIARMDLDSTRGKHAHEEIISTFENQQVDILVGTQMVTKGLDFAHVGLVGILNADNMLNFPDFRAFERSFQLMVQVSGRAGRKDERGKVIIQTSSPGHPIISNIISNDYLSMYQTQIEERTEFHYPPLYRLIRFTLKHKNADTCIAISDDLTQQFRLFLGNRVIGPDKPLISRIQNLHLRSILLKLERNAPISRIKKQLLETISKVQNKYKSVQISIDVDPA
jgi:primosomal protein N' (replication factor Y)